VETRAVLQLNQPALHAQRRFRHSKQIITLSLGSFQILLI
jgi:hypothetical protein